MGINFPPSPIVGETYPDPPLPGVPVYQWDGTAWIAEIESQPTYVKRIGDTMTGALTLPSDPSAALQAATKQYTDARVLTAAPFDALAYNGMQINGGMEVSQELGDAVQTGNGYILDGWAQFCQPPIALRSSRGKFASSSLMGPCYLEANVTTAQPTLAAGSIAVVYQPIEAYRVSRLRFGTGSAQTIVLCFHSAHFRTGLYAGAIHNGPNDRSYVFTYTHTTSNIWQYNVITIPGDTGGTWAIDNTAGLVINFTVAAGSDWIAPSANTWLAGNYKAVAGVVNGAATTSDSLRIASVALLPGTQAPTSTQASLLIRPYDQELVTCQRYWRRMNDLIGAAYINTNVTMLGSHRSMRAAPTATLSGLVTLSDVAYANPAQSTATIGGVTNTPDYGSYVLGAFTGLTVGRWYMSHPQSAGQLCLSARL
jgi:hypothetical protein